MNENKRTKRVGRPVKQLGIKKSYSINIRMDTSLYYHLKSQALQANITMSEYARGILLRGHVKQRISKDELALLKKLIGMANNLNQLARSAHVYGFAAIESDNADLAKSITAIIHQLNDR